MNRAAFLKALAVLPFVRDVVPSAYVRRTIRIEKNSLFPKFISPANDFGETTITITGVGMFSQSSMTSDAGS